MLDSVTCEKIKLSIHNLGMYSKSEHCHRDKHWVSA